MSDTASESDTGYVCRHCHEPVDHGLTKCPHCGGSARSRGAFNRVKSRNYRFSKWVCYLSIVGIPLGLVFRRWQRKAVEKGTRGIAVPAESV